MKKVKVKNKSKITKAGSKKKYEPGGSVLKPTPPSTPRIDVYNKDIKKLTSVAPKWLQEIAEDPRKTAARNAFRKNIKSDKLKKGGTVKVKSKKK